LSSQHDVTRLIQNLKAGKKEAGEALYALVYDELHALAGFYMRQERSDHTLQTTALVHEAYMRLEGASEAAWEDRAHFLRVATRSMRRVLIDYARRRGSDKRSGGWHRIALEEAVAFMEDPSTDVLDLDRALSRLSALDPQMGQVAELHIFGGLTLEETARLLEVTPWTAKRDWRLARAWLKEDLAGEG
jgi:RNA polymerase sigma factor (TIGR02999 family)